MELIDKAAVMAEINRVLNSYDPNEITSGRYALVDLRNFLNTLEVKDGDLEEEIASQYESNYEEYLTYEEFSDIAKHFFELGLKAKNE